MTGSGRKLHTDMEEVMEMTISKKEQFLASVSSVTSALAPVSGQMQASALDAIRDMDFPTTRMEDWKYTRTARISNESWTIADANVQADIRPYLIPGIKADVVVIVNGFYRPDLGMITSGDIVIETAWIEKEENIKYSNIFHALNHAYCTAAIRIRTTAGSAATKPVHVIHMITVPEALAQPSVFILAQQSSTLHVIETFVSTVKARSFTNHSLNVMVEENAVVTIDKIQMEHDESFLYNEENISVKANGQFTINTLTIDGGWVRNNLNISLDGKNIETHLNGIYLPRRRQHIDNHSKVDHHHPACESRELYKGILNDNGTGVFNGKVYVHPDAQTTNAYQNNANILLSDDAQVYTKPELEIYADDVKCSHGSTTGQMDENALFYLRSRGLGTDNARKLLTTAFINDVLSKIQTDAVRTYVADQLVERDLLFI